MLLQRNEFLTNKQKVLRKRFGRFIFTNFLIHLYQNKYLEKNANNLFERELNTFKKFLPVKVKNIMDIGCGLGIINIHLNQILKSKPIFFLLDKNRIDKKIKYGFSDNYESYNDLNETKKILLNNDIENERIHLFDVQKPIKINHQIDFVISLKSMGYHYPFELYLDLFKQCCSINTVFIFDVIDRDNNDDKLTKYFEDIKIIYEVKSIHPLKRFYCKNFILRNEK